MIKRFPQDVLFSEIIRSRDGWTCQRCSKGFDPTSSISRMGLHCSHYHGRGKWATRYDLDNCTALCYGCHRFLGGRPLEHTEFMIKRLGKKKFKELNTRSNIIKKKRDFINKEFRKELKLMLENE